MSSISWELTIQKSLQDAASQLNKESNSIKETTPSIPIQKNLKEAIIVQPLIFVLGLWEYQSKIEYQSPNLIAHFYQT